MSTIQRARERESGVGARLFAVLAAAFVAGVLALAPATGANAHDYLVDSSPAADSVQTTALKDVSLTFDDVVLDLGGDGSTSLIQVTGPNGASTHFETGCAAVSGRVVTAPVALGAPGSYALTWQIVSADGHTVSGSFTFTYQPPAGTAEAAGAPGRPACSGADDGTNAATPAPTTRAPDSSPSTNSSGAVDTSGSADSSLGIVITIAAVIIGIAVIGVIIILVSGRKRTRTPDSDDGADE